MVIRDFTYGGKELSDYDYIVCSFGSGGDMETVGEESNITLSTVPILKGSRFLLADTRYENYLTTTFQICKNPCTRSTRSSMIISPSEFSEIARWLNQKSFKRLDFDADGYEHIHFEATFNVRPIEIAGEIFGIELEVITNRPFGIGDKVSLTHTFLNAGDTYTFTDTSDEIGYIYPDKMKITCNATGNLTINNEIENRDTIINNCTSGEVIEINYPNITSSISDRKIQNDFNFNYFRIANTYESTTNKITVLLPCKVDLEYYPLVKIGI